MKITQTGFYQNSVSVNRNVSFDKTNFSSPTKDVFVKQLPVFKGGVQNVEAKILGNPDLLKKAAAFLMAGFASFVAKGAIDKNSQNEDESANVLVNMFATMAASQQDSVAQEQRIQELENQLKEKENELRAKEEQLETKEKELLEKQYQLSMVVSQNNPNDRNEEDIELVRVDFPKKRGRLTAEQEQLKKTIMLLPPLAKNSAGNLKYICYTLINAEPEEKEAKKEQVIKLNEELLRAGNNQKVINDIIASFSEETNQEITNDEPVNVESVDTNPVKDNIFKVEVPALERPKILGNIDVSKFTNIKATPEISEVDSSRNLSQITIAGTHSTQTCINKLLNQTMNEAIQQNDGKFVNMIKKIPVNNVSPNNVKEEIERRKREGNPYINLTIDDSEEIADLLSTGKFSKLFCLHSAMRLIDRYVDFDSKIPLEKQCDTIIEALDKAIRESFKLGLTYKPYRTISTVLEKDRTGNVIGETEKEYYSSKVFIETEKLDDDIQKVLGSIRIAVTFSRPDTRYNPNNLKGIISTIFSEGV